MPNFHCPRKILSLKKIAYALYGLMLSVTLCANESQPDLRGIKYRWPEGTFTWHYSTDNEPEWLTHELSLDLFRVAAAAWGQCGVDIQFQGILTQKVRPKDQINTFGWANLAKQIRGLTLRQPVKDTFYLKEADIVINRDNPHIQNNPTLLQKVITHEFGHALGLIHPESCSDVMSSAAECGWRIAHPPPTMPTPNDLAQCQARYPTSSTNVNAHPIHE